MLVASAATMLTTIAIAAPSRQPPTRHSRGHQTDCAEHDSGQRRQQRRRPAHPAPRRSPARPATRPPPAVRGTPLAPSTPSSRVRCATVRVVATATSTTPTNSTVTAISTTARPISSAWPSDGGLRADSVGHAEHDHHQERAGRGGDDGQHHLAGSGVAPPATRRTDPCAASVPLMRVSRAAETGRCCSSRCTGTSAPTIAIAGRNAATMPAACSHAVGVAIPGIDQRHSNTRAEHADEVRGEEDDRRLDEEEVQHLVGQADARHDAELAPPLLHGGEEGRHGDHESEAEADGRDEAERRSWSPCRRTAPRTSARTSADRCRRRCRRSGRGRWDPG